MTEEQNRWMISDADREALRTSKEEWNLTDKALYKRRGKIRERVVNGIIDFTMVQHQMSGWNWPKFVDLAEESEREVREGMVAAIALFYELHHSAGWNFRRTLWEAYEHAHTHGLSRGMPPGVVEDVPEPKIEQPENMDYNDMEGRILEKMREHKPLTDTEKAWAAEADSELFEKVRDYAQDNSQHRREERALKKYSGSAPDE